MKEHIANKDFVAKKIVVLTANYNDWLSMANFLPELDKILAPLKADVQVVIVDDGSTDMEGRDKVESLPLNAIESVDEVLLGCNQGNQRALAIGIGYVAENFECDYMVVMDFDHEDNPIYIPKLLASCLVNDDQKIIFAERTKRSEGKLFRFLYKLYTRIFRILTGINISIGNFCVIPGKHVSRLAFVKEVWSHFAAGIMRSRIPFATIPSDRGTRLFGKSKMGLVNLVIHAFGGFTAYVDVAVVRVLFFAIVASSFMFFSGFVAIITLRLTTDLLILGWASQTMLLLAIILLQVLTTSVAVLLLVLFFRSSIPPMTPKHFYKGFIMEINRLYSKIK